MRNRAKCKKCECIIESFHPTDFVSCKCEEIGIEGGPDNFKAYALDWNNFLRIDDNDKVIVPKIIEKEQEDKKQMKRSDYLEELDRLISSYENLPPVAMNNSVTHYDLLSALILVSCVFKAED